ncbi:YHS domain-containing (seleno)protein [uncultured Fibrella sp.]|uniref:YHS domain-containing (seleno)protein n=1 Tax=uncultured Fibrella sp. TaxID=1284596 RepID=UPI0035C9EEB2
MKLTSFRLAFIAILLAANTVFAQQSPVFATAGKAIRGYDPVAYFTESKPVMGDSTLAYSYRGANWYFASAANRDAFKATPDQYVPQYGGYCAYGTSQGHKAPTQPDAWTINGGKLYLNYNAKVKAIWDKDRPGYIEKADGIWPTIQDKDAH